jgi:iron(II)-dependent oxidoreductase
VFVALLSPAAVKSPWVKSETRVAIQLEHQKKMRVLPILLKPCDTSDLSTFIASYQIISFANRYDKALPELLVELGSSRARMAAQALARRLQGSNGKTRWAKHMRIDVPISMDLMRVPAGSFWMGSHAERDAGAQENEQPRHRVRLTDYYIARTPITQTQYALFAQATQRDFKLNEEKECHPVVNVSWHDAMAFCMWLSQLTGFQFSLPTEAEWEKAARGPDGQRYPWGSDMARLKFANANNEIGNTTPVGSFPYGISYYGALDMGGNVREWVFDWYDPEYFKRSPEANPLGPETGEAKVLKGASFKDPWRYSRAANRLSHEPQSPGNVRGFRCAYP